ncbi:DNA adenine methylase [Candidatus Sumerlaeota bacterium]|nr:DNA adenine methylase [Candidatus Sumerlaeota bacterium]
MSDACTTIATCLKKCFKTLAIILTVASAVCAPFASFASEAKPNMSGVVIRSARGNALPTEWPLKSPFPWFGGKSRVATEVWKRFGNPAFYIEPFAGSLAAFLGRPDFPSMETVNDKDGYVANFWRAVHSDPLAVAHQFLQPCFESDLHARRTALMSGKEEFTKRLASDPHYYDAQIAAWWAWTIHTSIAPQLKTDASKPRLLAIGLMKNYTLNDVVRWFEYLSARLAKVRVLTGDWRRAVSKGEVNQRNGITGIFFDPPYKAERLTYAVEIRDTAIEVREWALENEKPWLRIALCGHQKEHKMPSSWTEFRWKRQGGLAAGGLNYDPSRALESIWFSPSCLA